MLWIFEAKGDFHNHTYFHRWLHIRPIRHDTTPEIWQETYMSAILRAILYGDDPTYWLEAYRRLDPITAPESEVRLVEVAEALFSKGNAQLLYNEPADWTNCFRLASWLRSRNTSS